MRRSVRGSFEISLLLATCELVACNPKHEPRKDTIVKATKEELPKLEKELGVRFPEGARLLGTHREEGMDDYVGVKVEIPAHALGPFIAGCPIPRERFEPGNGGLLGPDEDGFWDPNQQPKLQTGQAQLPGARVLNIGFDDSRQDVAFLYVVNHGT